MLDILVWLVNVGILVEAAPIVCASGVACEDRSAQGMVWPVSDKGYQLLLSSESG